MASVDEVDQYLTEFKLKMSVWDVLFLHRDKNIQTLSDLEITPRDRKEVLNSLEPTDYSEGPLEDNMMSGADLWVFGRTIRSAEVYIKITVGNPNLSVICISFHVAEHPMSYPLKSVL